MYGARGWVAHHNTDLWRATGADRRSRNRACGRPAAPGSAAAVGSLRVHRRPRYLAAHLPAAEGRGASSSSTRWSRSPTHHWLVTSPSLSPENPHPFGTLAATGPTMDGQILRDLFAQRDRARRRPSGIDTGPSASSGARPARGWRRYQIGSAGQLQEWLRRLGHAGAGDPPPPRVAPVTASIPGTTSTSARHARAGRGGAKRSLEIRGDQATGWATAWRINLWARLRRRRPRLRHSRFLLGPERPIPTCSTRTRRSRSTATSAALPASRKCCCSVTTGRSIFCRRFPARGRTVTSPGCELPEDLK